MSVLPGANYLGFGFNVYQDITIAGRTRPVFDLEQRGGGRFELGQQIYDVPENAIVNPPDQPGTFNQSIYESCSEFVRDLQIEANVSAVVGGFEGKASAKYDRLCQGMQNAVLCRISDTRPSYYIDLKSRDATHFTAAFKADLDALPATYTDATRIRFLRFFHTYGMFFIKSVAMGGRLNYFYGYERQQTGTTESIKGEVEASYNGIKGGGSASWAQVNKSMFQSARKSIETMPAGSLNSVTPTFGEDLGQAYEDWVRAAKEEPSLFSFRLEPISDLVTDEQKYDALSAALADFGECYISAEATTHSEWRHPGRISVKGHPLAPEKELPSSLTHQVARQVVVDRHTLAVRLDRVYGYRRGNDASYAAEVSGDMLQDVLPYNNPDHFLILTTSLESPQKHNICVTSDLVGAIRTPTPNQTKYFDLLRNAGADNELHSMLFNDYVPHTGLGGPKVQDTAYVFVGVLGAGKAREAFGHVPTGMSHDLHVIVSLEPVEKHGQLYYDPVL